MCHWFGSSFSVYLIMTMIFKAFEIHDFVIEQFLLCYSTYSCHNVGSYELLTFLVQDSDKYTFLH